MPSMTRRDRVMAALRGDEVDRLPVAFWSHNFAKENSARELADETVRLAEEFDWDFLKPQCRAQCFAEAWGAVWKSSGERTVNPTPVSYPLQQIGDLANLGPVDPIGGPFAEQLEALRLIRAAVGPDTPIVWTVFNPLMISRYLFSGGVEMMLEALRTEPKLMHQALDSITTTMAEYARAAVANGADGLFYATNVATEGLTTPNQYKEFGPRYDRRILDAVGDAPFNMMHICGDSIYLDLFTDYPVHAFNWALGSANPSLGQVERRTGKAVIGGVSTKPVDRDMSPEQIAAEVEAAVSEMRGRHLLVGPGCSSSPSNPDANFHAARKAARGE